MTRPTAIADTEVLDGIDIAAVQSYLERLLPGTAGTLRAALIHGGRSNLTYLLSDGRSQFVLRRPPLGPLTPSAHDMAREYRIVSALAATPVPVAEPIALCEDESVIGVPFSVVRYVPGRVLRTREDLEPLTDEQVQRCADGMMSLLADLHAVAYLDAGLQEFGRPAGYVGRQVRRWRDQWDRVTTRESSDFARLHSLLTDQVPAEGGASVVHGDYRVDNLILDPVDPGLGRALVDWEMATIGDPLADLGLTLAYRDPAFEPVLGGSAAATSPRMPPARSLAEAYARASGRHLDNLDFYVALGYLKAAVIAEGIHARFIAGQTRGAGFETAGSAVPALIAGGLAALTGNRW